MVNRRLDDEVGMCGEEALGHALGFLAQHGADREHEDSARPHRLGHAGQQRELQRGEAVERRRLDAPAALRVAANRAGVAAKR